MRCWRSHSGQHFITVARSPVTRAKKDRQCPFSMGWPEVMNHSSSTGWIWRLWASSGFWTGRGSSRLPQQETGGLPGGGDEIAALGADKKSNVFHASSCVVGFRETAGEQSGQIHAQLEGQGGQQGEVRGPQSALPLGDGPVADSQQLGQPLLGQPFFQPQTRISAPVFF